MGVRVWKRTRMRVADGSMQNLAIYIHYPFCKSKCPYCDFNSHVREKVEDDAWLQAYLRELEYFKNLASDREVTSIFFGGGTPSLMNPKTTEALLNYINNNWKLSPDLEVTLEANPTSVEYDKFKDFRAAGVNRVSIGVQSFNEPELKFLGREHSSGEAKKAIQLAAQIFPRYSFDLIYALPEQKLGNWEKDLSEAIKLTNGHISLYQLTIEPNTNFAAQYKNGAFRIPENEVAAEFYELTQNICEANDLPAYEISNHAKLGDESRHNLSYWNYDQYIGIGPGAHGRINGHASVMTKSPEKWLEKVAKNDHGLEEWTALSEDEKFEEKVMMGMRLNYGLKIDTSKLHNLEALKQNGFIEYNTDSIRPTKKGLLMLNAVVDKLLN